MRYLSALGLSRRDTLPTMRDISDDVQEKAEKSATDRIRSVYDTTTLHAIMGRFHEARQ